jgi:hypothetical protein
MVEMLLLAKFKEALEEDPLPVDPILEFWGLLFCLNKEEFEDETDSFFNLAIGKGFCFSITRIFTLLPLCSTVSLGTCIPEWGLVYFFSKDIFVLLLELISCFFEASKTFKSFSSV